MDTVNFLALLWGFSLTMVSFSFLAKPSHVKNLFVALEHQSTLIFLSMLSIVLGVASVLSYNVWSQSWPVIITILGWLLIAKGVFSLFVPEKTLELIEKAKKGYENWLPIASVVGVILGCALVYFGLTF